MHIYNNKLEYQATIPHDLETIKKHGINKIYPTFQGDWWLTKTKFNYPKLENGEIIEKTKYDLYLENIYKLQDGEIAQGNDIITVPAPNNLLKPYWTGAEWVEHATKEELDRSRFESASRFYNDELVFASKATAEFACLIISPENFEEVKKYMQSIDPYAKTKLVKKAKRPSVFDRYK